MLTTQWIVRTCWCGLLRTSEALFNVSANLGSRARNFAFLHHGFQGGDVDRSKMPPGMRRRDFVRASAGASLGVMTAGGLFKAAEAVAAAPGGAEGPGVAGPYVGAGSTAAI